MRQQVIATHCFEKTWIDAKKAEIGGGDPTLIEKVICAFALLGYLAEKEVPLVFKGGTSLILRLPKIRRLSIDIDILCQLPDSELDKILAEIAVKSPFVRYEEDDRGRERLPARRHFKFFYTSTIPASGNAYVLLDVVSESAPHPETELIPISTPLFETEKDVSVIVPTIENLLGDKLTAFAPETVGIPCTERYAMQVMKQLYDIGMLIDASTQFDKVEAAYNAVFKVEDSYRGNKFTTSAALNDTIETARLLCQHNLRGSPQNDIQALLDRGRQALGSHIISGRFLESDAKIAASKAAFLSTCIRDGKIADIASRIPYNSSYVDRLKSVVLPDAVLQRLRGGNPEAFYNWALALGEL